MKEMRLNYPVPLLKRVLSVSAGGYYDWLDRPLSNWAREESRLEVEIRAADKRTRQVYGAEKLQYDLAKYGIRVGICRIKRIRRKLGIRCKQKQEFKATTNSKHTFPVADNILGQQFKVLIEQWRKEYNQVRPHSARNNRPPAPEAVLVNLTT
ncbi:IS3 family transposase [Chloroflexota bacterium]